MSSEIVEGVYVAPIGKAGVNICLVSREAAGLWWIQESHLVAENEPDAAVAALHDEFVVASQDAVRYLRNGDFVLVSDPSKAEALKARLFPPRGTIRSLA